MFGISGIEFLFIAVLVLILFGPDKLPEFGRTIGRMMKQFNEAKDQMEHMVRSEMYGGGSDSSASPFSPSSPFASAPAQPSDTQEAPRRSDVDFVEDEEEEEEE